MTTLKRIFAMALTVVIVISLSACNSDEDDSVLTTRKRVTTTQSQDASIDIWGYIDGDSSELALEEPGTISSGGSYSGNYTYEDTPVSFGGQDIFSSATTSKQGYPTFKWSAVSGAIRYNIYRSTSKGGNYTYLDSTTATSYTDKTAISGTKYYYQVKAVKKVPATTTPTTKPSSSSTTAAVSVTKRDMSNAPATAPRTFSTKSALVNFYNTAANQVKSLATGVVLVSRNVSVIENSENSETLSMLVTLAKAQEVKSSNAKAYSGHANVLARFPIEDSETSSTLTSSMVEDPGVVKSIDLDGDGTADNIQTSYSYANGYYHVFLLLKNDPSATTTYSQTCMDVIKPSKYGFTGTTSETRGAIIYAKISYDGHLDNVLYYVPTWIYIKESNGDIKIDTYVALGIQETWYAAY